MAGMAYTCLEIRTVEEAEKERVANTIQTKLTNSPSLGHLGRERAIRGAQHRGAKNDGKPGMGEPFGELALGRHFEGW
jgi:hypothetical protein